MKNTRKPKKGSRQLKIANTLFGEKPQAVSIPAQMLAASECKAEFLKKGQLNKLGLPRWVLQYLCDIWNFSMVEQVEIKYDAARDDATIVRIK